MLEKIKKILADNIDLPDDLSETTAFADLGVDSLDMMQIIMEIEDAFGITVADDADLKTVGELMTYIEAQKKDS